MRREGKVSPNKAARLLGVDRKTVLKHCAAAVQGQPSKLRNVEKNPISGHYLIDYQEVQALRGRA